METRKPLRDSRSVVLDANGFGAVIFGPSRPNTRWEVTRISVQVSSNVAEPAANVYRGNPASGSFITGTYAGSNDTDSSVNDGPLWPGEYYTCVWTNGDVGAVAVVTFGGEEITGVG